MRKIKILTSILGIVSIAFVATPLNSCAKTHFCTVKFDAQNETAITEVKIEENSTVNKPTDPTKENYSFGGGYTEPECINIFDFNTKITSNITLYAKGISLHTITFSASDGITLTGQSKVTVTDKTKGKDVEKPTVDVPEKYDNLGGYNGLNKITDETEITSDFNARYIGYKYDETFVNVTVKTAKADYRNNTFIQGSTGASFKQYYEITEDPQKEGCVFTGWYDGDTKVEDDYEFKVGITHTIIEAHFQEFNKTVTFEKTDGVTFDPVTPSPVTVAHGTKGSEVPNKPSVTVGQEYDDAGGYIKGKYTKLTDDTQITSDITAKYYALPKTVLPIEVTLKIDGIENVVTYYQGASGKEFKQEHIKEDPKKEGYTFTGGYVDGNKINEETYVLPSQSTLTVEARFTIKKCTVSFAVDEGAQFKTPLVAIDVNYKTKGKDVENPGVILKPDYVENGGYSDKTGRMTDDSEILDDTTVTYKTIEKAKAKINVYVKVEDTTYGPIEYVKCKTWGQFKKDFKFSDPTKQGYYFIGGLYKNEKINDDGIFPVDSETDITIEAKFLVSFAADSWENVCQYNNEGGLDKLHEVYKIDCENNEQYPGTLIGLKKTIMMNDCEHVFRVIAEKHDSLADGSGQAALTFDMVTLLYDKKSGGCATSGDAKNCRNYLNSKLRGNLNDTGTGTKPKGCGKKSAFKMLPDVLQNNIKAVNKQVATYNQEVGNYTVVDYADKLFPLTPTEMAQPASSKVLVAGSPYAYGQNHNTSKDRIKAKDVIYGLASPCISGSDIGAGGVNQNGDFYGNYYVDSGLCVSYAFCI